jgi:hypothetical protein
LKLLAARPTTSQPKHQLMIGSMTPPPAIPDPNGEIESTLAL